MKNKNGLIWCNVWLTSINKGKCVIAIPTDNEYYQLISNSSLMKRETGWEVLEDKPGWFYKLAKKEDITIFN